MPDVGRLGPRDLTPTGGEWSAPRPGEATASGPPAADGSGGAVDHDGGVQTGDRIIELAEGFNFRDLGGYVGRDGRLTRWRTLFRSDTLHQLTERDLEVLRSLGLSTIVDLRTSRELERTGRGPLASEPIGYRHLSVIRDGEGEALAAPAAPGDELSERYLWYLETGRDALVEAVRLLARPDNLPLVFHCAAGKDRTGVLAALVLDLLEVDHRVIVEDYVITAERMPLIMGRLQADPAMAARVAEMPAYLHSVQAQTMERFLAELHARFGGARAWALASGLGPDDLVRMEELLLEPPG
jgi:protein-tyrosine phosphatase